MQHMLQRPALPWAVQRDIHLFRRQYLLHAHGDAPFRHSRQIAALVAEGIDRPGLPADGQHTGPQIGIRVRGDGIVGFRRLVEGHMTVDAQSAKAHIHAAQTGDQLVVLFFMSRLREMPLRLRHDQTLIHPVIEFPLHPAVEAHGVVLADPLGRRNQILVHVEEVDVFQRYPLAVDQLRQNGVLIRRPHRDNKHRRLPRLIIFDDLLKHGQRHVKVHVPFLFHHTAGNSVDYLFQCFPPPDYLIGLIFQFSP